ncbi:copper amine oxidase N-terminal domain-containing protein [Fictibacillus sp. 7GRE50]|uniref:copper amine oxidase N-terminal domain-containing protein n=1 Tax=Fictibacillus sp. 7GRE50 TaxID=2745878 RepID=UPI0018CDF5DB|nr:copper amine oxidase N-terminal domain-containing protein [Fictibacillus sp. 7GRE50]MBH0166248.1 copper amine oxidase N-terminal domain-containing protein [Fictibacillus sp. 7GRE50]
MKKKILLSTVGTAVIAASFAGGVYAASALKLIVNGVQSNAEAKIISNRTYVPLRAAAEMLGAEVNWDSKTNTVTVNGKDYDPTPGKAYTVNISGTSGPMEITISKVTLDNSYNYNDYSEPIRAVVLDVVIENTSSESISWHPDQGTLVLNTKEQIENPILYSDDLGGEFHGKVIKKGKIAFKTASSFDSVSTLKFVIDGSFDSNLDRVGEDLSLDINLK